MDIQVDINDTFDSFKSGGGPGKPLVDKTVATVVVPQVISIKPGVPIPPGTPTETWGTFSVALAPGQKYFWRARPHTNVAWGNCEPIFWFTTGDRPGVPWIIPPVADSPPGSLSVSAPQYGGQSKYKFQVSERDTKCVSKAGVEEHVVDPLILYYDDHVHLQPNAVATFPDLQPDHDYWLNVLPFGPDDPDGKPGEGRCYAEAFHTLGLGTPLVFGTNTTEVDYFGEQPDCSGARPEALKRAAFVCIQSMRQGGCDYGTIADEETLEQPCDGLFCPMSLQVPDFNVRNGTGYCWDVTGISTDGHESPSSESRFGYRLELARREIAWGSDCRDGERSKSGAVAGKFLRQARQVRVAGRAGGAGLHAESRHLPLG